jgi:hypothetical protein
VDRFLDVYFRALQFEPPPPVSDALFARRVYLDLWGLLPTPEQLDEFARDTRSDKRERLVDALLSNRRNYAEHWITFWNDLLRNDEGVVYHGTRESITKWLVKALQDNLAYDKFVSALLNPAAESDPKGFLTGVNWRGDVSASQTAPMQAAQNSAQVFLGVNLKCNSCHDSFISHWKLKDAYGLASFFAPEDLEMYRCDVKTGAKSEPQFLFPELGRVPPGATLEERHAQAARLFTARENGRFARTLVNRIWDRLFGRGLVPTVDDMERESWNSDLLDWLAADFIDHDYDIQHLLRRIMTSQAYQLPAVDAPSGKYVFRGPLFRRLTAEQFVDAISSITGEWRAAAGTYAREWRLKSSPLTRGMGRPIRDQVFTQRNSEATTLQALEMVNGDTVTKLLDRGARRLLGQLRTPPVPLFDSGVVSRNAVQADIDITGVKKLWLLTDDADSYDPARTVAGWVFTSFPLPTQKKTLHLRDREPAEALVMPLNSTLILDNPGATRFQATVGVDQSSLQSDISPRVRFFVFAEEPDRQQLAKVSGEPPVPATREAFSIERLYRYAIARGPGRKEAQIANSFPRTSEGLADLLWSVFLLPEFQYIR